MVDEGGHFGPSAKETKGTKANRKVSIATQKREVWEKKKAAKKKAATSAKRKGTKTPKAKPKSTKPTSKNQYPLFDRRESVHSY